MKKILISIFTLIIIVSCTSLGINKSFMTNYQINNKASKVLNADVNVVVGSASIKNLSTYVKNGKLNSTLAFRYEVLGGTVIGNEGTIKIVTDVKLENNKLYMVNPKIVEVKDNNNTEINPMVYRAIESTILNMISINPIYTFEDINVKGITLTDAGIILDLE